MENRFADESLLLYDILAHVSALFAEMRFLTSHDENGFLTKTLDRGFGEQCDLLRNKPR